MFRQEAAVRDCTAARGTKKITCFLCKDSDAVDALSMQALDYLGDQSFANSHALQA